MFGYISEYYGSVKLKHKIDHHNLTVVWGYQKLSL